MTNLYENAHYTLSAGLGNSAVLNSDSIML